MFRGIYNWLGAAFPGWLCWLDFFLSGFTIILIIVNGLMVLATLYTWVERRVIARFQVRVGPNRWGPFGLLQPIADAVKLLTKEDIVPKGADRIVFNAAPVVMFVPVLLMLAVLPIARNTYLANLNIGVLYLVAVSGLSSLAIFMAGWSSGNKYAMFGAMRGVAQLLSYEIPVVLSIASVVLLAGSLAMTRVVEAQTVPFLLVQPLGALIFLLGTSAELNRSPFDIVEAESELIAGYHTEYSGMKFGVFMLAEFAAVLVASAIMATLYLGGWSGPFLSGQLGVLWFLAKVFLFTFMFIWVRATIPRLRIDQIMAFAWKFLFPLSLVNLVVTAALVYWLRSPEGILTTADLWVMVPINLVVAVAAIAVFQNMIKDRMRVPKGLAPAAPLAVPGEGD